MQAWLVARVTLLEALRGVLKAVDLPVRMRREVAGRQRRRQRAGWRRTRIGDTERPTLLERERSRDVLAEMVYEFCDREYVDARSTGSTGDVAGRTVRDWVCKTRLLHCQAHGFFGLDGDGLSWDSE